MSRQRDISASHASVLVKLSVDGFHVSGTFDSLSEARAYRDSKKASIALDLDPKRVLEARVTRSEVRSTP